MNRENAYTVLAQKINWRNGMLDSWSIQEDGFCYVLIKKGLLKDPTEFRIGMIGDYCLLKVLSMSSIRRVWGDLQPKLDHKLIIKDNIATLGDVTFPIEQWKSHALTAEQKRQLYNHITVNHLFDFTVEVPISRVAYRRSEFKYIRDIGYSGYWWCMDRHTKHSLAEVKSTLGRNTAWDDLVESC